MPKSVKIASVVVVALLLVVVVVMLSQQSPKPRNSTETTAPPEKTPVPKPAYTPNTDMTPERLPGTDSIDPNNTPSMPQSPSGPVAIQSNDSGPTMQPLAVPATQPTQADVPVPTSEPATPVSETMTAPPAAIVIAPPTTLPSNPATPASPAPEQNRTYTVKAGDTLSSIAKQNLGSESRWHEVAEANPMVDPIKLRIGQVLNMPSTAAADANGVKPASQPRDPSGRIIYIVRPLDSLASIAKQYYGTRDLWKVIYSANRANIGSNPDKLEPGTRLFIPPAPQPAR